MSRSQGEKTDSDGPKSGSLFLAIIIGVALVLFAAAAFVTNTNPLCAVAPHLIVAGSSLIFGIVLLAWALMRRIGNPTVNMVVGIVAATVAIGSFAQQMHGETCRTQYSTVTDTPQFPSR